jgi:hypothetical protein
MTDNSEKSVAREPAAFSEGYRIGMLSKFSIKGLSRKSGEGELMLGNESSLFQWKSGDSTRLINPWLFSVIDSNPELINKISSMVDNYVIIKYQQSLVYNPLSSDTGYRVIDVLPVNTKSQPANCIASSSVMSRGTGDYSDGVRTGRIVKMSNKGVVNKTYESIVQVGPAGNYFQPMSIAEEEMAKCVFQFLSSGKMAKITYHQAAIIFDPTSQDSTYEIIKVEAIPNSGRVKTLNDVQ